MKKLFIGIVLGSGVIYFTLSFQPSLLVTIGETVCDTTAVKKDSIIAPLEIPGVSASPSVVNDTAKADTTQK